MDKPVNKRSVFRSLKDAFRGIWCSIKSERNMRIHLTAAVYVWFSAFSIGVSRTEMAVLALVIGMVIAAEMLNTAIEKHCDFNQKNYCGPIRNVKDIAAGAVLTTAIAAVLTGLFIFWRDSFWAFLFSFVQMPVKGLIAVCSFVLAWFFIFWGPIKIAETICAAFIKKS